MSGGDVGRSRWEVAVVGVRHRGWEVAVAEVRCRGVGGRLGRRWICKIGGWTAAWIPQHGGGGLVGALWALVGAAAGLWCVV